MARRIAAAAAYGSGGVGLLGCAAFGLLVTEAQLARRTVGSRGAHNVAPRADGCYGSAFARLPHREADAEVRPLLLALLGDSTAAGLGVHRARETPGALLAYGLAAVAERPVTLVNVANPGAESKDLDRQVSLLLDGDEHPNGGDHTNREGHGSGEGHRIGGGHRRGQSPPDVCVIMIGANDVTHRVPPATSVRLLSDAVRRLRQAGAEVVVCTCPDLGTIEPVYQPLRWIARRLSRQLAAAQTIAVVGLGGRTVSLGDLLGPEFAARPREMFGPDNFHPSAEGYAHAAMAVLPTLCAALGLWPRDDAERTEPDGVLPVAEAAVEAAAAGGTEVAAAVDTPTGTRGRWALLRRRPHAGLPAGELTAHQSPARPG